MAGYGAPPPAGGYGAPPPGAGYGAPPPGGYMRPPPPGAGYGQAPPPAAGYGAPPPGQYPPPAAGGYPPQGAYPPAQPPRDPLMDAFQGAAGPDGQISAEELEMVLSRTGMGDFPRPGHRFSLETCRLMIALLDVDHSGTMGFGEFRQLFAALESWKGIFQKHDRNASGAIEAAELNAAINEYGYNLSPEALQIIVKRYSKRSNGQISFDDFVAASVRLRAMSQAFRARDQQGQGFATLHYDDFLKITMAV